MKKNLFKRHIIWLIIAAWVYTFTFIFNNYWSKYASYQSVTNSFQASLKKRESQFANWVKDTVYLNNLSLGIKSAPLLKQVKKLPFYVFLFRNGDTTGTPVFWSTNAVIPAPNQVKYVASGSFVNLGNGQYELLKKQVLLTAGTFTIVGLVQLHEQFFIENGVLRQEYPGFPGLGDKMILSETPTKYAINGENGRPIAWFRPGVAEPIYVFNWLSFITQCISSILLIVFVNRFCSDLIKRNFAGGMLSFTASIVILRVTVDYFGIPIDFGHFPLFADETVLTSAGMQQLRYFMMQTMFGLWAALFVRRQTSQILGYFSKLAKGTRWVLFFVVAGLSVSGHFLLIKTIRNLYLNSTVAFDLTNFFSFNFTTILSFLIIFLLCVTHYIFLRFTVLAYKRLSLTNNYFILLLLAGVGLVLLSFLPNRSFVLPLIFALAWLLLFYIVAFARVIKPAVLSSGMIVAWLFIYSMSLSLFLGLLGDSRLRARTNKLGKSLLLQKDETSERLLKIAAQSVKRIDWGNLLKLSVSETRAHQYRDSIIHKYFSGYLDRFNTNIYIFDRNKLQLFNSGGLTFESLNTLYATQAITINAEENLAWFGESFDQFGYIIKQEITDKYKNNLQGYVFVMIRSLRSSNQAFSPELFRQLQNFAINLPQDFSYAWYKNGILVEQYRNYPFQTNLPVQMLNGRSRWDHQTPDAYELWLNAGSDNTLAIAANRNVFTSYISMLAYLFDVFLIFYCLYALVVVIAKGNLSGEILEKINLNLQTKIRLTVVTILTVSFVIVAIVTISFFISQFTSDNTEKLAQSIQDVSAELARKLPNNFDTLNGVTKSDALQTTLLEITKSHKIDVNCFDTNGVLIASTQNILYEKGVLSPMADPVVWWNLTGGEVHRYISNENIGNLSYSSIYQPMLNRHNQVSMYLQVPFFASQSELNREISNFLVILINIIALVFLLSGSLAYWISGSLTRSFNEIAEKMNRIRLSEQNERIEWAPKDEIGNLVFQYNKMVDQLEDSAKKMARTEREMAWREMAKQVAHEIKNPLTPMKLSLQFLQKAIKEKNGDIAQITQRVASNLVGQIDHLSKIATDFSRFANLGNYKPEPFNLQDTLREVIQIYDMQEHVSISWNSLSEPLRILADKTQINRLVTNLLQNASESGDKKGIVQITIGERLVPGSVIFSVSDNGQGIPEAVKNNIFMPNFTTKSSGTGLGLSICKAIVENAGGAIWFETESGKGTTFYVRLPLTK